MNYRLQQKSFSMTSSFAEMWQMNSCSLVWCSCQTTRGDHTQLPWTLLEKEKRKKNQQQKTKPPALQMQYDCSRNLTSSSEEGGCHMYFLLLFHTESSSVGLCCIVLKLFSFYNNGILMTSLIDIQDANWPVFNFIMVFLRRSNIIESLRELQSFFLW